MRQYRIGDLTTGKGYTVHASSRRVALNYIFRSHIDEFLHDADYDNERMLNLIVTDLGASMWIQRVVREPDRWQKVVLGFDGAEWYGDPRTEEQRVLVADGIPDGWKRVSSTKTATRIYRDTCGICGAKSPQEDTHKAHN
jgi:hypothetical protein